MNIAKKFHAKQVQVLKMNEVNFQHQWGHSQVLLEKNIVFIIVCSYIIINRFLILATFSSVCEPLLLYALIFLVYFTRTWK